MLNTIIEIKKQAWLKSEDCKIKPILAYIQQKGQLREAQVKAISTYLFLKIKGQNKPIYQLFLEGFFLRNIYNLDELLLKTTIRNVLATNKAALTLFEIVKEKENKELEQLILQEANTINYEKVVKELFYNINYTDYLFSLPMGAGKTFLMAAIIYLELYFATTEPDNPIFAHNFILLVPSGLKSSIIPSLKTIQHFDPTWVVAEPAATEIKKSLKFEVLDQSKSDNKSNRAKNPNAQKVSMFQPFSSLKGLVLVVNAEKVILDRVILTEQQELIEKTDDEKDKYANELRNLIGKIPNLQIHIDEVHHAATDDIKLRKVIAKWQNDKTINSVLGYSGTPYLNNYEKITINNDFALKSKQITNTVFYYPLIEAIEKFLKKPTIKSPEGLKPMEIVEEGVKDFLNKYQNTVYHDKTCAKLAIYCGSIERLENDIYPFLIGTLKINPDVILKYHKGNAKYTLPKQNETEFATLDMPFSKKQIILLVQVGKEGWDCKSLTGVILSQQGDCPPNMILQTSCRCLRQVTKQNKDATALIWLNEKNAKVFESQLKKEQGTSIKEINEISQGSSINKTKVPRYARLEHLKLPKIDFYQLKIAYNTLEVEENKDVTVELQTINAKNYWTEGSITSKGLVEGQMPTTIELLEKTTGKRITFNQWLLNICKNSFGLIDMSLLLQYKTQLIKLFEAITFKEEDTFYFNSRYDDNAVTAAVRLAFHQKRNFKMYMETVPESAQMLIIEQLESIVFNESLYPTTDIVEKIITTDKTGSILNKNDIQQKYKDYVSEKISRGEFDSIIGYEDFAKKHLPTNEVHQKDKTFHYLPYNFFQSNFEKDFLINTLALDTFKNKNLEIYYNGERHLTDFKIVCYAKRGTTYQKIGYYTPDFLIIRRKDDAIEKILIVETKGKGFAEQSQFLERKHFLETDFLQHNNTKFGYDKFQYLVLTDDNKAWRSTLNEVLQSFFD